MRFWGTRGSIARPALEMSRYGGNTSCTEVRLDDGTLIVLDCGTGAYPLGQSLVSGADKTRRGHIFISHTHWDHIQGLPFFAPLFMAGGEWDIYGPGGLGQHLEAMLAGQMEYSYFPVTLDQLSASVHYHDLQEETLTIGGLRVVTKYMNHPALTLGYRFEADGVSLVYAVDHEPHALHQFAASGRSKVTLEMLLVHAEERRHLQFLSGADLIIHDTQYTAAEYPAKVGWGHSSMDYAVAMAMGAEAKQLAFFHHDPLRTDEELDQLVLAHQQSVMMSRTLGLFGATEGQLVELQGTVSKQRAASAEVAATGVAPDGPLMLAQKTILIVDDDPQIVRVLTLILQSEGFRLLTANDGAAGLRLAEHERPDLIISDWEMPELTGLELCQNLRSHHDAQVRDVPLILLTALGDSESTGSGFAAGVSDYLTKPFSPAHVRARVQAWLLRSAHAPDREGALGG